MKIPLHEMSLFEFMLLMKFGMTLVKPSLNIWQEEVCHLFQRLKRNISTVFFTRVLRNQVPKNKEIKSWRIFEYAGRSFRNRFESFIGNQRGTKNGKNYFNLKISEFLLLSSIFFSVWILCLEYWCS